MKRILIHLCTVILLGCGHNKYEHETEVIARCEKIIIQDTIHKKTLHFVVKFENKGNNDVLLFANSSYEEQESDNYKNAGVFLTYKNFDTPLGQFHPSNVFRLQKDDSLKILYTYDDYYPNRQLNFDINSTYIEEIRKIKLQYRFNKAITDTIRDYELKNDEIVMLNSNVEIEMDRATIIYKNAFSLDDLIKLTNRRAN